MFRIEQLQSNYPDNRNDIRFSKLKLFTSTEMLLLSIIKLTGSLVLHLSKYTHKLYIHKTQHHCKTLAELTI